MTRVWMLIVLIVLVATGTVLLVARPSPSSADATSYRSWRVTTVTRH